MGTACLLVACEEENALPPSGNDTNFFTPADDDHSPAAELRRSFYDETNVYLFFTDTLRHVQNGVNAYGEPVYETEMMNLNYNLTGFDNDTGYILTYYTDYDNMKAAADIVKNNFFSHLSTDMLPYSVLLLDSIYADPGNYDDWEYVDYLSNSYCMAIAMGDVAGKTEEEGRSLMSVILKSIVDDAISDLDYDDYQGAFYDVIPGEVFDSYLGELIPGWDRTQMDALYELGLIDYYEDWYGEVYYDEPNSYDWSNFFDLVMDNSWEDIEAQYGQYDIFMRRAVIVRDAILATGYKF